MIYGLVDPRTKFVHYVGLSGCGLRRPRRHRTEHTGSAAKVAWVLELQALGLDFDIVVLEYVDDPRAPAPHPLWTNTDRNPTALAEAERFWIAYGRASGWPLTNIQEGGLGARGHKMSPETTVRMRAAQVKSPETRRKLSLAHKGKVISDSTRAKIALAKIGSHHTDETRAKMSAAHQGHRPTAETRARMSAARLALGFKHTPETIARIAAKRRGFKHTAETKAKIGAALKGRVFTAEHRAKISAAKRGH